jgi:hypothetical protein
MALSPSPEFSLAAACAMWPPSDRRTEAIQAAAVGPLDWSRFLRVVTRHQIHGLVNDGLRRAQVAAAPEIKREISTQAETLVRESLIMAAEAVRLQDLLDKAGLEALFFKGTSLALLAYGNLGLRSSKDIDLLVSPRALPPATALIASLGYRRFDPPPDISDAQLRLLMPLRRDLGFVHEETGLQIELHWQLFLNPHAMDETSVMASSRFVPLTATSGLRTLGEDDLLTYLCVHGALHCWSQLKWLADIGALLTAATEDGAERLNRVAEVRGAGRAAAQAILLCHRVLGVTVPPSLMIALGESRKVGWLTQTALNAMTAGQGEREPREIRFGTTRGSLSGFLLRRSWRYCLAELRNILTNQNDVLTVPLPERLRFLYPILRLPLWVWRQARQRDAPNLRRKVPKLKEEGSSSMSPRM